MEVVTTSAVKGTARIRSRRRITTFNREAMKTRDELIELIRQAGEAALISKETDTAVVLGVLIKAMRQRDEGKVADACVRCFPPANESQL